jgi:hypothetical protein
MTVSKRLRYEVLRRDNHSCRYCGATAPDVKLTVDHVTPVTLGGTDQPDNLVAACADCNSGKSATPADARLVVDVAADALRWAGAMQRAAHLQDEDAAQTAEYIHAVDHAWRDDLDQAPPRPSDWASSIGQMRRAGLSINDLTTAVGIAHASRASWFSVWKYFCGVCWRTLEQRQRIARDLLAEKEWG